MAADSPAGLATLDAAAKRLSANRRYLYRLRDRGELEFVYLGEASPRVRVSDLARLEDEGVLVQRRGRRTSRQAVA